MKGKHEGKALIHIALKLKKTRVSLWEDDVEEDKVEETRADFSKSEMNWSKSGDRRR